MFHFCVTLDTMFKLYLWQYLINSNFCVSKVVQQHPSVVENIAGLTRSSKFPTFSAVEKIAEIG